MRALMLVAAALLAALALAPEPAAADHVPCFSHWDHGIRFRCAPDLSDPTCIEWYFEIGVAYICPREVLP